MNGMNIITDVTEKPLVQQSSAGKDALKTEMGIYRDIFLLIIVIAQNSFDLSIPDNAFVIYLVIADQLSR